MFTPTSIYWNCVFTPRLPTPAMPTGGSKRSGGHRDAVADFQRSLHAIAGTDMRILQDLRIVVAEDGPGRHRVDGDGIVAGIQVLQVLKFRPLVAGGWWSCRPFQCLQECCFPPG